MNLTDRERLYLRVKTIFNVHPDSNNFDDLINRVCDRYERLSVTDGKQAAEEYLVKEIRSCHARFQKD